MIEYYNILEQTPIGVKVEFTSNCFNDEEEPFSFVAYYNKKIKMYW